MKIALAQINPTIGDLEGNRELILDYARRACDRGTDLVAGIEPHAATLRYYIVRLFPITGFRHAVPHRN